MARMIRKQVYIQERQQAVLRRLARKQGVSEAAVIRQAIDGQLDGGQTRFSPPDDGAWRKVLASMRGAQRSNRSRARARSWKRDDLYEERLSRYDRRPR
jgi:hypothetical protein